MILSDNYHINIVQCRERTKITAFSCEQQALLDLAVRLILKERHYEQKMMILRTL